MGTIYSYPFMMTTPSSIDLHQMNLLEKSKPNAISIIVNHADQSMSRIMQLNEFGRCEMNDCDELEPKVPDFHNSHYPHQHLLYDLLSVNYVNENTLFYWPDKS